jgi:hypothetical protein
MKPALAIGFTESYFPKYESVYWGYWGKKYF